MKNKIYLWGFAVVLLDALFWLYIGSVCAWSPLNCENATVFGPYFWYQPFTNWFATGKIDLPFLIKYSVFWTNVLLALVGGAFHFLVGCGIGYIYKKLRNK